MTFIKIKFLKVKFQWSFFFPKVCFSWLEGRSISFLYLVAKVCWKMKSVFVPSYWYRWYPYPMEVQNVVWSKQTNLSAFMQSYSSSVAASSSVRMRMWEKCHVLEMKEMSTQSHTSPPYLPRYWSSPEEISKYGVLEVPVLKDGGIKHSASAKAHSGMKQSGRLLEGQM